MNRIVALTVGITIAIVCSIDVARAGSASMDQAGNIYPPECAGDLSDEPGDVVPVSRETLRARNSRFDREMEGFTTITYSGGTCPVSGPPIWGCAVKGRKVQFLVDENLRGWKRVDAIKHERCHGRMERLTGNAEWHR